MADKDFTTISDRKACDTVIKGSRFIGVAVPIHDEEDLRDSIASVMEEFPEATHYCYGAVYGGSNRTERSSDNGEPSGTAGRPILNVIKKSGLTDTVVIVVRYFGGTLLGTGGLTHAYTSSATAVLSMCGTVVRRVCVVVSLSIPYQDYDRFNRYMLPMFNGKPDISFGTTIDIHGPVPKDSIDDFMDLLIQTFDGRMTAKQVAQGYY